jgi:hypothetical protein
MTNLGRSATTLCSAAAKEKVEVEVGSSVRISTPLFDVLPLTQDCTRAVRPKVYHLWGLLAIRLLSGLARRSVVMLLQPAVAHGLPTWASFHVAWLILVERTIA